MTGTLNGKLAALTAGQLLAFMLRVMIIGIGGFLLIATLWIAGNNIYVLQTYHHAEAEVISSDRIGPPASKGSNRYSVQVRFQGPDGRQTASVEGATTGWEVGEIIDVYYLPETAFRVTAGGFQQMWSSMTLIAFVAVMMLFFGSRTFGPPLETNGRSET
jgi:hypothetical protein